MRTRNQYHSRPLRVKISKTMSSCGVAWCGMALNALNNIELYTKQIYQTYHTICQHNKMDTIIQFLLVAVSIFIKHSIENYYIIARFNFCQALSEHCEAESVTSRYFCIVNPRTHQYLFYLIQCSAPQRNLDRLDRPSFMHWSFFCKSPKTFNFEAVWSQNGLKRLI